MLMVSNQKFEMALTVIAFSGKNGNWKTTKMLWTVVVKERKVDI